jgi:hypothetical protein
VQRQKKGNDNREGGDRHASLRSAHDDKRKGILKQVQDDKKEEILKYPESSSEEHSHKTKAQTFTFK